MASDKELLDELLSTPEFKRMVRQEVGAYRPEIDWRKNEICFVGPKITKTLSIDVILKSIRYPNKKDKKG